MTRSGIPLEFIRATFGLTELLLPGLVAERLLGHPADPRERLFIRVLGVRHPIQALVLLPLPGPTPHRLGALIDGIHAGTMIAVPVKDPPRKVAATVNATIAIVFAAGELA